MNDELAGTQRKTVATTRSRSGRRLVGVEKVLKERIIKERIVAEERGVELWISGITRRLTLTRRHSTRNGNWSRMRQDMWNR